MLDLIAEWRCATRAPRAAARTEALAAIRTFRRYHLEPERAAFAAAVGRNRRNEP